LDTDKIPEIKTFKNRTKDNGTQTKYGLRNLRVQAIRD